MKLNGVEVKTIEEAFSLLPIEQQEHARRVAAYSEAAFARACVKDLYIGEMLGKTELVIENRSFAHEAGLYHDIGKLAEGQELPGNYIELLLEREEMGVHEMPSADHTLWGPYIIRELYPRFRSAKTYHQRMLLNGVGEHHERMDGTGAPWQKEGKAIGYMGRIVAIADELDHRAMKKRSEDPIGSVLKELKAEAAKGLYDENFVKCFSGSAASLRRTFDEYRSSAKAVPLAEAWIKRRPSRPMELRYQPCYDREKKSAAWLASMHFRSPREGYQPYSAVQKLIASRKIGPDIGDYFLYELCDSLRRFKSCGVAEDMAFIELPEGWYSRKKLAESIARVLADEELSAEHVTFLLPASLLEKPNKAFTENRAACESAGYRFLTPEEAAKAIKMSDKAPLLTEDDIALAAIDNAVEVTGPESGASE